MSKSGYFFRVSPLDPHAATLKATIEKLIKQNIFSRVVRDAIRLWADLSDGKTAVLEELFPFVRTHYCNDDSSDRMQRFIDEAVRKALLQQRTIISNDPNLPAPPPGYPAMKPSTAAPVAQIKAAVAASADEIADNFMSFIQM